MSDHLSLVILAGNIGKQYEWQKQIDPVGPYRETLLEYSIFDALEIGIRHFVFIINQDFSAETKKYFQHIIDRNSSQVEFILQTTYTAVPRSIYDSIDNRKLPWGTGHALLIAKSHLSHPFIIIDADHLHGRRTFYKAKELFIERKILPNRYGLVTYSLLKTITEDDLVTRGLCSLNKDYLKVIKKFNSIHFNNDNEIVSDEIDEDLVFDNEANVSMNFWILHPSIFRFLEDKFNSFLKNNAKELDKTFSLYKVINDMIKEDQLEVIVRKSDERCFGLYNKESKYKIIENIRNSIEVDIYPKPLWK